MASRRQGESDDEREAAIESTEEPTDADDTAGHSTANYEFVRQEARERSRETREWARKEALRRESRGWIDRLRRR